MARGAQTLVDLLLRRIDGQDTPSVTLPAQLIVRESSMWTGS
jgi:DNA-binding LacI/PurR family transcriptional regulator